MPVHLTGSRKSTATYGRRKSEAQPPRQHPEFPQNSREILVIRRQQASKSASPALLANHPIVITIIHEDVSRMIFVDWSYTVPSRFFTGNSAVTIVIPTG